DQTPGRTVESGDQVLSRARSTDRWLGNRLRPMALYLLILIHLFVSQGNPNGDRTQRIQTPARNLTRGSRLGVRGGEADHAGPDPLVRRQPRRGRPPAQRAAGEEGTAAAQREDLPGLLPGALP